MATPTMNLQPLTWEYDVFLSFRGEDTRKTFTDHLYSAFRRAEIHTFRDEEQLKKGEYLAPEFTRAIQSSRISIIIFSKDYASSRWCLDELIQILECKETGKQTVFPIFYDVTPSEVRRQNGNYGIALANHEKCFQGSDKIQKWRDALTKVANMSGWDLQDRYESKLIDEITQEVILIVNRMPIYIDKHVVGLESQVDHMVQFMSEKDDDNVRMIGIYGMGGIGKTTLAKALYNILFRYFERSCFLEINSGIYEMKRLQEELLSELLQRKVEVHSEGQGKMLIKRWLQNKKCLIVLDNLEHINQFEALCEERDWFGGESRIILTTRDTHVFKELKDDEHYEAMILNHEESLKLFSLHAFKECSSPKEDYVEVSNGIVAYCEGLPLALKVLGAYLSDKSKENWNSAFEKLKKIPHKDVQDKLMISYEGLPDYHIKSLFLDLVCFSSRVSKKTIDSMGCFSSIEIQDLIDKCLINCEGSWITMHNLIREMGRHIIQLQSPNNPGERSRLWCPNDIHNVLVGLHKGTNTIEVIIFNASPVKNMKYRTNTFKSMKNLRILVIDGVNVSGKYKHLSKKLRYLQWKECPLKHINIPSNCSIKKLKLTM